MRSPGTVLRAALLASSALLPAAALAQPSGGTVVAGSATIGRTATQTTVTQTTNRAVIDWNRFDVPNGHAVRIDQPNAASWSLQRVTGGGGASTIAGQLSSNGGVAIVNPAGVTFAGTAVVDVAGLIATTSDTTNSGFMAGRMAFTAGTPNAGARVEAQAGSRITVRDQGLAALVGPVVANGGTIRARLGRVAMAGGVERFTLDLAGDGLLSIDVTRMVTATPAGTAALVTNTGTIEAQGGSVLLSASAASALLETLVQAGGTITTADPGARGGQVAIRASGGEARVTGEIRATGQRGGTIEVNGAATRIAAGARLDASGEAAGGRVTVGAAASSQRRRPEQLAASTVVERGATIRADATVQGRGGEVIVHSAARTEAMGEVSARGGPQGGDGGAIEVSSRGVLILDAVLDTAAPQGRAGEILLDPATLRVVGALSPTGSLPTGVSEVTAASVYGNSNPIVLEADNRIDVLQYGTKAGGNLTLRTTNATPDAETGVFLQAPSGTLLLGSGQLTVETSGQFASGGSVFGNGGVSVVAGSVSVTGFLSGSFSSLPGDLALRSTGTMTLGATGTAGEIRAFNITLNSGGAMEVNTTVIANLGGTITLTSGSSIALLGGNLATGNPLLGFGETRVNGRVELSAQTGINQPGTHRGVKTGTLTASTAAGDILLLGGDGSLNFPGNEALVLAGASTPGTFALRLRSQESAAFSTPYTQITAPVSAALVSLDTGGIRQAATGAAITTAELRLVTRRSFEATRLNGAGNNIQAIGTSELILGDQFIGLTSGNHSIVTTGDIRFIGPVTPSALGGGTLSVTSQNGSISQAPTGAGVTVGLLLFAPNGSVRLDGVGNQAGVSSGSALGAFVIRDTLGVPGVSGFGVSNVTAAEIELRGTGIVSGDGLVTPVLRVDAGGRATFNSMQVGTVREFRGTGESNNLTNTGALVLDGPIVIGPQGGSAGFLQVIAGGNVTGGPNLALSAGRFAVSSQNGRVELTSGIAASRITARAATSIDIRAGVPLLTIDDGLPNEAPTVRFESTGALRVDAGIRGTTSVTLVAGSGITQSAGTSGTPRAVATPLLRVGTTTGDVLLDNGFNEVAALGQSSVPGRLALTQENAFQITEAVQAGTLDLTIGFGTISQAATGAGITAGTLRAAITYPDIFDTQTPLQVLLTGGGNRIGALGTSNARTAIAVATAGNIAVTGTVRTASLRLTSTDGAITQSPTGSAITATEAVLTAATDIILDGAGNQILNPRGSAGGTFAVVGTQPGAMELTGPITADVVQLSNSGAITQAASGAGIDAGTLRVVSGGTVTLTAADNLVDALGASSAVGSLELRSSVPVALGGAMAITPSGGTSLLRVRSSGDITTTGAGPSGSIGTLDLISGGSVTLAGALDPDVVQGSAATLFSVSTGGAALTTGAIGAQSIRIRSAGTLAIGTALSAPSITLLATGAITQLSGATLTTGPTTLSVASDGDVVLEDPGNAIEALRDSSAGGRLALFTTTDLALRGSIAAGTTLTLRSAGGIALDGVALNAGSAALLAAPGGFTAPAASTFAAAAAPSRPVLILDSRATGLAAIPGGVAPDQAGLADDAQATQLAAFGTATNGAAGAMALSLNAGVQPVFLLLDGATATGSLAAGRLGLRATGGSADLTGSVGGVADEGAAALARIGTVDPAYLFNTCTIGLATCATTPPPPPPPPPPPSGALVLPDVLPGATATPGISEEDLRAASPGAPVRRAGAPMGPLVFVLPEIPLTPVRPPPSGTATDVVLPNAVAQDF